MDAAIFLGVAIAVLCGVAYLIGHTHGKSAGPSSPSYPAAGGSGTTGAPDVNAKPSTGAEAQE